jgi:hypothetical protein
MHRLIITVAKRAKKLTDSSPTPLLLPAVAAVAAVAAAVAVVVILEPDCDALCQPHLPFLVEPLLHQ